MKFIILFAALAVAFVSAAPQPQQSQQENDPTNCTPGASWKVNCNTCTCMPNGQAACTLALCLNKRSVEDSAASDCVAGTWWMPDDCNTCHCSKDGKGGACTLMECLPRTEPFPADHKECSTGAVWQKDGKACTCTAEGKASCAAKTTDKTCTPGSRWMEDCNSCICAEDGKKACSKMFCIKDPQHLQPSQ